MGKCIIRLTFEDIYKYLKLPKDVEIVDSRFPYIDNRTVIDLKLYGNRLPVVKEGKQLPYMSIEDVICSSVSSKAKDVVDWESTNRAAMFVPKT